MRMRDLKTIEDDFNSTNNDINHTEDILKNYSFYASKNMVNRSYQEYAQYLEELKIYRNEVAKEYNQVKDTLSRNNTMQYNMQPNTSIGRPMYTNGNMQQGGTNIYTNPYSGVDKNTIRGGGTQMDNPSSIGSRYHSFQPNQNQQSEAITRVMGDNDYTNSNFNNNVPNVNNSEQNVKNIEIAKIVIPNYIKEKNITIKDINNKIEITGKPTESNTEIEFLENRPLNISPLWVAEGSKIVITPLRKLKIPYNAKWEKYLEKYFSDITFPEVPKDELNIENTLYYHIKPILENLATLSTNMLITSSGISDIKDLLEDKTIETKSIMLINKAFREVILTRDKDKEGKLLDTITFDLGGKHVYYKNRNLDVSNIVKSFTTKEVDNKFILVEESYSELFQAIRSSGASHGILEIYGGIQFKFYSTKEVISLVRQ